MKEMIKGSGRQAKGFTIVELLIVILIVAILAVITVVAFTGVREKAQESSVRLDLRNIANQVNIYKVHNGRYPTTTELQQIGITVNKQTYGVNPTGATIFYCVSDDGAVFSVVNRVKSGVLLQYVSTESQVKNYSGSPTAPQLCLDSGVPGTTSLVSFIGFTDNGAWASWVRG